MSHLDGQSEISTQIAAARRRRAGNATYSRFVRIMKIFLPLSAVAVVSLVFLISRADLEGGFVLSKEDMKALGEGLRLVSPEFSGATEAGEPFVVRAAWALPDGPNPTSIALGRVVGEITLLDGRGVELRSPDGAMRPRDRTLALTGGVEVDSSDGYRVRTERADIDIRARSVVAETPVRAWGPIGSIDAGAMRASRDERVGDVIRFDGGVRVVFRPGDANGQGDLPK